MESGRMRESEIGWAVLQHDKVGLGHMMIYIVIM